MNSVYRPIFIIISLFFLSAGGYFFYALKKDLFFEDLKQSQIAPSVKDEVIKVYNNKILDGQLSKRSYRLEKEGCIIEWEVSVYTNKKMELRYIPFENNCNVDNEKLKSYHLSTLKKIFKTYDKNNFEFLYLPSLVEWRVDLIGPQRIVIKNTISSNRSELTLTEKGIFINNATESKAFDGLHHTLHLFGLFPELIEVESLISGSIKDLPLVTEQWGIKPNDDEQFNFDAKNLKFKLTPIKKEE